jgi:hypothetical protein
VRSADSPSHSLRSAGIGPCPCRGAREIEFAREGEDEGGVRNGKLGFELNGAGVSSAISVVA